MKILILDSTDTRPDAMAAALRQAAKGDIAVNVKIIAGVEDYDAIEDCRPDLLLFHTNDRAIRQYLNNDGFRPSSELEYSEGGCANGIPHSISRHNPITTEDAEAILRIVRDFPAEMRGDEFKKIWSGVPDLLVAWVLWKNLLSEKVSMAFDDSEIRVAYNQLRATVELRSKESGLPQKCAQGAFPSLNDAKLLVELARVDL